MNTTQVLPILALLATIGCGIISGLLFAFSNFVMRALGQLPAAHGMEAMQRINVSIVNPLFLLVFVGTAILCIGLAAISLPTLSKPGHLWFALGSGCYVLGVIGVTAVFNIPLNNRLANTVASVAAEVWPKYIADWQRWNHVRTLLAVVALACIAYGLVKSSTPPQ